MRRMAVRPRGVPLSVPGLGIAIMVTSAAFAVAQEQPTKPVAGSLASPVYTVGPADVLQIIVWKEPDLTRDVTVRFDGMITMPLLGDVPAAGRTPAAIAESLTSGLQRFIQTPRVTVGVAQATSARFYVVGQVGRSGDFPLTGRTTVLQALALAGGFRDFAKTDEIVLVRRDQTVVPVNYRRIADGKDTSQNVMLRPGDTLVVP